MRQVIRFRRTLTAEHWKYENGVKVMIAQPQSAVIELEIHVDGLFDDIGQKALRSKGGRAREVGGLVTARRLK